MPTAQHGRAEIEINAPAELVYGLVSDVTRMGEWSPECHRCEWLGGATSAAVGARFRGYNKLGLLRWQTTSVIKAATPGVEFAFTVIDDKSERESSDWRYQFEPTSAGMRLVESFEFVWCPVPSRAAELFIPRGRQINRGIDETLHRLKAAAEKSAVQI